MENKRIKSLIYLSGILLSVMMVLILSGCATTYEVQFGENSFKARSYREFKKINVQYKDFSLTASGVTDDTAEVASIITGSILGTVDAMGNVWIKTPDMD